MVRIIFVEPRFAELRQRTLRKPLTKSASRALRAGATSVIKAVLTEAIEGKFHNRMVVIEFDSIEAARAAAAGYSALRDTRGASAPDYNSVIVEGV